jgi:hypothetical protein
MAQLKVSHGRRKRTCPEGFAIVDGAGVTPHGANMGSNSFAVNHWLKTGDKTVR